MPIIFDVDESKPYMTVTFLGKITDEDLFNYWKDFLDSPRWVPGLNELGNLEEADLSELTFEGIEKSMLYMAEKYARHNVQNKVAVYAPTDLPYALSSMYTSIVKDPLGNIHVFRVLDNAVAWLLGGENVEGVYSGNQDSSEIM